MSLKTDYFGFVLGTDAESQTSKSSALARSTATGEASVTTGMEQRGRHHEVMSFVVMELKPAEVEYLNSMWRCALCDHLGVFHRDAGEPEDIEHCVDCAGDCEGVSLYYSPGCLISGCSCQEYR